MIFLIKKPVVSPKSFQKPQESYKKFQGRNPYNIFVAIPVKMMTPTRHFEINWPLAGSTNSTSAFCSIGQVFESSNSWIFGPNWLLQLPLVLTFKKIPTAAYIFLTSWLWCDMIMARQLHNIGALYKCPQSLSFRLCLPLQLCYYTEDERRRNEFFAGWLYFSGRNADRQSFFCMLLKTLLPHLTISSLARLYYTVLCPWLCRFSFYW